MKSIKKIRKKMTWSNYWKKNIKPQKEVKVPLAKNNYTKNIISSQSLIQIILLSRVVRNFSTNLKGDLRGRRSIAV